MPTLEELLHQCAVEPGGRIVSSGDLNEPQILQARSQGRMHVTDSGLGYVLLPWNLTTGKDRSREALYFALSEDD